MNLHPLAIEGVFLLENFKAEDDRGFFVKTFHEETFKANGLQTHFKESYYSISVRNVIRGMHFQLPPHDHEKLVYVTDGEILDVVLDIRNASPTYGQFLTVTLTEKSNSIYIPKGCAHGFLTISDRATVVYNVATVYQPTADAGIRWNSIGYDWQGINEPIISPRDWAFDSLSDLNSPFSL